METRMTHPGFKLLCVAAAFMLSACTKPSNETGINFPVPTPPAKEQEPEVDNGKLKIGTKDDICEGGRVPYFVCLDSDSGWKMSGKPGWISAVKSEGGAGGKQIVPLILSKNTSGSPRDAELVFKSESGCTVKLKLTQQPYAAPSVSTLDDKTFIVCCNSHIYFGGVVKHTGARQNDSGMLFQMAKQYGAKNCNVIDCSYAGHRLRDFTEAGCTETSKEPATCSGKGFDLLSGIDLKAVDYVIIAQDGSNRSNFYSEAIAVYDRFAAVNPHVQPMIINYCYTVFKKHKYVLNGMKDLYSNYGTIVVNAGELINDICTGGAKLPNSSITNWGQYTFINHKGTNDDTGDIHHPNPLSGYIYTQMVVNALTGAAPLDQAGHTALLNNNSVRFAAGSDKYTISTYKGLFYTTPDDDVDFDAVLADKATMDDIKSLMPIYINRCPSY